MKVTLNKQALVENKDYSVSGRTITFDRLPKGRKTDLTPSQATDLARYFLGLDWRCFKSIEASEPMGVAEYCLYIGRSDQPGYQRYYAPTWRAVFRLAGVKLPVRPQFSPQKERVMQGDKCVAVACSPTFATRTANALNEYEPDRRGL